MCILQYDDIFGTHTLAFYHVDELLAFAHVSKLTIFKVKTGKYV